MALGSAIDQLCRLQELDKKLYQLRADQKIKPEELRSAQARLEQQQAALKQAEEELKAIQLTQKGKEVELQTKEEQAKKLQGQLMQLKTNKEYAAMQHEIATIKSDNSLIEDAILQILDRVEEATQAREAQKQKLAEVQQSFDQEKQRIQKAIDEIEGQIGELERDRKTYTPEIPKEFLDVYERILAARDGVAIVAVTNSSCGGCNQRMPPQVINQIMMKSELIICESCSRILYQGEEAV